MKLPILLFAWLRQKTNVISGFGQLKSTLIMSGAVLSWRVGVPVSGRQELVVFLDDFSCCAAGVKMGDEDHWPGFFIAEPGWIPLS